MVATGPVVAGAAPVLGHVDILRVVEVGVGRVHDGVNDARLQVQQHGAGDVVLVVRLDAKTVPSAALTPA